jgi:hypothetical protein
MKIVKLAGAVAGFLMLVGQAVAADVSTPAIGTWIDKLPDGATMVLNFTPDSVSFQPFDQSGRGGAPATMKVTYKKDANGDLQLTPETEVGEPLRVTMKDANTLELQFAGREPRTLTRQKAEGPRGH